MLTQSVDYSPAYRSDWVNPAAASPDPTANHPGNSSLRNPRGKQAAMTLKPHWKKFQQMDAPNN